MITDGFDDNEDIKRQLRSFYGKENMQLRTFNNWSAYVKKSCFPLIVVVCILATYGASKLYGNTGKCMLRVMILSCDYWVTINFVMQVKCFWKSRLVISMLE